MPSLSTELYQKIHYWMFVKNQAPQKYFPGKYNGLKCLQTPGCLFVEQDPHTFSKYAQMAQEGYGIYWVIKLGKDGSKDEYLGAAVDGEPDKDLQKWI